MKNILVIEDNINNQKVIKMSLASAYDKGFFDFKICVECVATIEDASKYLESITPDLIILDLMLPDSSEEKSYYKIRDLTDTPVIVFSCLTDTGKIESLINAGVKSYLVKPLTHIVPTLATEINNVLGSYELLYA